MKDISSQPVSRPAIQFGILFGVIMVLEFVVAYSMDIDPTTNPAFGWIINILNYAVLPVIFIAMGCNAYKKANDGFISFGQCLKIGVITCLIAAVIYGIFFVIFTLIFPEFIPEMMEKMKSAMIAQNPDMTDDQMEMALSMTEKFMKPAIMIPVTLLMYTFIGFIWALIIGAVVKKDRPVSI